MTSEVESDLGIQLNDLNYICSCVSLASICHFSQNGNTTPPPSLSICQDEPARKNNINIDCFVISTKSVKVQRLGTNAKNLHNPDYFPMLQCRVVLMCLGRTYTYLRMTYELFMTS